MQAGWCIHLSKQGANNSWKNIVRNWEWTFQKTQKGWTLEGQRNPYYCAMVETLDYYVGKLIGYLERTEDPRWPGHKLIENTYMIFSSDNGGMEGYSNIRVYGQLSLG